LRFAAVTIYMLLTFSVLMTGSAALSSMSETTSIVEMMDKGWYLAGHPLHPQAHSSVRTSASLQP